MPTKEERSAIISQLPISSMFLVKRNGLYWRVDARGYSNDITEAKIFTQQEIIERLSSNGLIDKEIIHYAKAATI